MDINRNNYESFFLLYLDRELDEPGRKAVEKFLAENSDLQKEFIQLQNTIQWPADIVFEQKELLYRREDKRRIIPVYWMRVAATLALVLTGSWFLILWIAKNPGREIADKGKSLSSTASARRDQEPANPGLENGLNKSSKNGAGETDQAANPSPGDPDAGNHAIDPPLQQTGKKVSGQKGIAESGNPGKSVSLEKGGSDRGGGVKQGGSDRQAMADQAAAKLDQEPGENGIDMKKSNAALDLQTSLKPAGTDHRQIAVLPKTETPVLITAAVATDRQMSIENAGQPDLQTDNAISVIALNDRNKAIAGFFKKLTRREPGDETVNNTKKLRVSVFQISY